MAEQDKSISNYGFLKNVVSQQWLNSWVVVAGTILIFIFVGALVGGLVTAFTEGAEGGVSINEDKANVLVFDMNTSIIERGAEMIYRLT